MMKGKILSLAVAAILAAPLAANAKAITYDFTVNGGDVGPLANVSSSGSFTFDSSIIPVGGGEATGLGLLTGLSFNWDGISYHQTPDTTGTLGFNSDGTLAGLTIGDYCSVSEPGCTVRWAGTDWAVSGTSYDTTFLYTIGDNSLYSGTAAISQPTAAPEIDPGMAASAMTMLLGGLAVLRGRRGKA